MQTSTPLSLGQLGVCTGGGWNVAEAALDKVLCGELLMFVGDDVGSPTSISKLWETEWSKTDVHDAADQNDLQIAIWSVLNQTTQLNMDQTTRSNMDRPPTPTRRPSIPLPSIPVLGGQDLAAKTDDRKHPKGHALTERPSSKHRAGQCQEPSTSYILFENMLPTPEPSPVRSNFPIQLDGHPEQRMGGEFHFQGYQDLPAGQYQKPHAGPSRVRCMPPTPIPTPLQPDFSSDCQQQESRGGSHSQFRQTSVEINGHCFVKFTELSSVKYECVDSQCLGIGKRLGRKQECVRHAQNIIINCTYSYRERDGCSYSNRRRDKVLAHEKKEHGFHRDGCNCRECGAKGQTNEQA